MTVINEKTCSPRAHARQRPPLVRLALVALAFAFAYSPVVPLLISTWSYPDFSHGVIVPFVSLYLVWIRRSSLRDLPFEPSLAAGVTVTVAGAVLLLLGTTGSVVIVQEAAAIVLIPGLVLLLLGKKYLRALALPLGYLVLMVPVLTPFLEAIYWPLQLITTKLAALMLPAAGVPVYHNNQFLELPNISLEVAEACSGAQFLVSVFAIAIPLAYISLRGRAARITLFALAFLITIFSNSLRVALIGFLAYTYDKKTALHGPYHILTGYFVFMVGFVFLFLSAWLIARRSGGAAREEQAGPAKKPGPGFAGVKRGFQTACILAFVMLAATGTFIHTYEPVHVPLRKPLSELPLSIDAWKGERISFDIDRLKVPDAQSETSMLYTGPEGRNIKLYVGYLAAQTQETEIINVHFSDLYEKIEQVDISLASGESMRVNRALVTEGSREFIVTYWYDINGRAVASRHAAKLLGAVGGLIHRRTNGAIVILKSAADGGGIHGDAAGHEEFTRRLQPVLKGYLPSAGPL